ncbi:MAG TPA: hypothetical protein DCG32_11225 [Sphaerochaeta sp.]|nr:hypothetical protein [Sphaerochaeta sp.]
MNKRILLFLFVMLFVLVLLNANDAATGTDLLPRSGQAESPSVTNPIDLGQGQLEDSVGGLLEGTATSDGFFSISYAPDFSFNRLSFQLDLKLQGQAVNDPFGITLDFSYWELPPREADQSIGDYSMAVLLHYSSFIRYIQWGDRYEPIYVRYGKLAGITLGDGALLNGFFDLGVGTHVTRPGLNVTLDGTLVHVSNAGFEFVTNDLFNPTLLAWRMYSRPFTLKYPESYFSHVEFGVSFAENPSVSFIDSENPHTRKLIAIDMGIPLVARNHFNLAFFADLLIQTPGASSSQPTLATRYGIFGHSRSFFLFNTSLTIPAFGTYYTDYFDSGFEQLTQADRDKSILSVGSMRIDMTAGLNFTKLGAYLRTRIRSDYSNGNFSNYKFQANARIDKRLFNIVSLDLSYEKLYPIPTGGDGGEGFFEGLYTLRNVEITASTIIKIKPYSFTIGLSMVYDDLAQSTLQVDTAVRISIL